MSITRKITKLQLANLVNSPISWAVVLVFALYTGILFTNQVEQMTTFYLQRPSEGPFTRQLVNFNGFIGKIVDLLFLFIPLLGMGLISNEINSGTIKLLYSSPIKIRSIVLGKFLAMVVFNTIIVAILFLVGLGAYFFIEHIDWGIVLSFSLGIYLLACTYSAVTLFTSSLSKYQIISAILAIALLYAVDYLGRIETATPILSDVLPWLAIGTHARNILTGYFISVDFIYFLCIIGLFLFATICKMNADRMTSNENRFLIGQIVAVVLVIVGVIYVANKPQLKVYADVTNAKQHTIPDYGIDMLKRFKGKELTLKLTGNAISNRALAPNSLKSTLRGYDNYTRFKPNLKIEPSLFYAEPRYHFFDGDHKDLNIHQKMDLVAKYRGYDRKKVAFIESLPAEKQEWLKKSDITSGILRSFSFDNKERFIIGTGRDDNAVYTTIVDDFTALTAFFEPKRQVVFLQGNKERQINRDWETDWSRMATAIRHRFSLINNGFEVTGVDPNTQDIPVFTDILVIADPLQGYTKEALSKITAYIDSGKNLFLALGVKSGETLDDVLKNLQIEVKGKVTSDEPNMVDGQLKAAFSAEVPELFKTFTEKGHFGNAAFALEYTGQEFEAFPVIETIGHNDPIIKDRANTNSALITTLALQRVKNGKEQHILVTGDSDLLANKSLLQNNQTHFSHVPTSIFRGYFHWLTNGVYPINMYPFRQGGKDNALTTSYEKVTAYKVIYIGLIPLIIGLAGFLIWIIRSRK